MCFLCTLLCVLLEFLEDYHANYFIISYINIAQKPSWKKACGMTYHNKCHIFPPNCLCQYRWVGLAMTVQWWASAVPRRSQLLSPRPLPPAHHPVSQLLQQWPSQLFLQLPTGLIWSLPHIFSVPTVPTANLKYLTFLTLSLLNMLQNKSGWDGLTGLLHC